MSVVNHNYILSNFIPVDLHANENKVYRMYFYVRFQKDLMIKMSNHFLYIQTRHKSVRTIDLENTIHGYVGPIPRKYTFGFTVVATSNNDLALRQKVFPGQIADHHHRSTPKSTSHCATLHAT